eukprot:scaffold1019_cov324-Prasinococcus_capsulatus_cf.AAC.2
MSVVGEGSSSSGRTQRRRTCRKLRLAWGADRVCAVPRAGCRAAGERTLPHLPSDRAGCGSMRRRRSAANARPANRGRAQGSSQRAAMTAASR